VDLNLKQVTNLQRVLFYTTVSYAFWSILSRNSDDKTKEVLYSTTLPVLEPHNTKKFKTPNLPTGAHLLEEGQRKLLFIKIIENIAALLPFYSTTTNKTPSANALENCTTYPQRLYASAGLQIH
jgi:hypothetical protein